MQAGMDSLALNSVFGLIGHSSKGLRTESHWPNLGPRTLNPNPLNFYSGWGVMLYLPSLAYLLMREPELGQVPQPRGLWQVEGCFPEENEGVATRRRNG